MGNAESCRDLFAGHSLRPRVSNRLTAVSGCGIGQTLVLGHGSGQLLDAGIGTASVAKSYRVLRAILNTAVEDGLIRRNPCRIKGAGDDKTSERQVLDIDRVYAIVEAFGGRYRAPVLLATFTSLRFGELAALRRRDVDLGTGSSAWFGRRRRRGGRAWL